MVSALAAWRHTDRLTRSDRGSVVVHELSRALRGLNSVFSAVHLAAPLTQRLRAARRDEGSDTRNAVRVSSEPAAALAASWAGRGHRYALAATSIYGQTSASFG